MELDRALAGSEGSRYLFVELAGDDALHDFLLAAGEGIEALPELRLSRLLQFGHTVGGKRFVDGIEQNLTAKWFGEELHCTGFHRLHGHGNIAVACDEDDGYVDASRAEIALEFESARFGEADIKNEATGAGGEVVCGEFAGGMKGLDAETDGVQEALGGVTRSAVIIHDEDNGLLHGWSIGHTGVSEGMGSSN
jgi:hypothetical protein